MGDQPQRWHHRPAHRFVPNAMYMVTCGTLHKEHFFCADDRLALLQDALFEVTEAYGWRLQAWAVLSSHYHFVAQSPENAKTLKPMLQRLHSQTARAVNRLDGAPGRKVWFEYRDTCLTYESSYYARLNYVHTNPAKHEVAAVATQYPYCSAAWFERNADQSFQNKVKSFRCDRVQVDDDF